MTEARGSWAKHPAGLPAGIDPVELNRSFDPNSEVVGLGAICDLGKHVVSRHGTSQSFSVSEFALLADGDRVVLHQERGFTIGSNGPSIQETETPESVTQNVLTVVLPDEGEDDDEDHPWLLLATMATERGLNVAAEDLRGLRYKVVFSDRLTAWLAQGHRDDI